MKKTREQKQAEKNLKAMKKLATKLMKVSERA